MLIFAMTGFRHVPFSSAAVDKIHRARPREKGKKKRRTSERQLCFSPYLYRLGILSSGSSTRSSNTVAVAQYGKPAASYLAFIELESIRLRLRTNESTP
jgi:hypothetical protein